MRLKAQNPVLALPYSVSALVTSLGDRVGS